MLIAALHARSLARSAWRGGHRVAVVDLYNDLDTRTYADQSRDVAASAGGFVSEALLASADELAPAPCGLVAGTGFEDRPALLARLAKNRELIGNTPKTGRMVKDPATFFPLLDALRLPHPEISSVLPRDPTGWLSKQVGGHGGTHIQPASDSVASATARYFQRVVEGRSCSALFLADGQSARLIGFNEQFTAHCGDGAYWYAGAINRVDLHHSVRRDIACKLDGLVAACRLVGLNSIDFIAAGECYWVLEVNPRPSATLDLYDDDIPGGLFGWHMRACRGELPAIVPIGKVRAHRVVYAPQALRLHSRFSFPDWCSDIPEVGDDFMGGAPVCMVHAAGADATETKKLIDQRRSLIEQCLIERAA
jgi:predicted ATP-grasp superfamily ATP-dependent carboligase